MKRFFLFFGINILIVATLSIVLSLLGIGSYIEQGRLNLVSLSIFCLIWGMGGAFISLALSKWMAKKMMGIQIITPHQAGPYLHILESVHRFSRQAGLSRMPEVGIYESDEVNAFATGPSKKNSLVAVSTGLMRKMNKDEVDGVLAHEVAHIANGDMVTMTLIQGIMNAFVMFLARIVAWGISSAMSKNSDGEESQSSFSPMLNMIIVFVLEIIFGIVASIAISWFSRQREFRADRGGAKLAGKDRMIAALESLKKTYDSLIPQAESSLKTMQISSKNSWFQLFSTHPSLNDRIQALKNQF